MPERSDGSGWKACIQTMIIHLNGTSCVQTMCSIGKNRIHKAEEAIPFAIGHAGIRSRKVAGLAFAPATLALDRRPTLQRVARYEGLRR